MGRKPRKINEELKSCLHINTDNGSTNALDLQLFALRNEETSDEVSPVISPPPIRKTRKFTAMLNGVATNQLTNISTRSSPLVVDNTTGDATIEQGNLTVFINKYLKLKGGGLRTSTYKLLDVCTMALTDQNHYRSKDANINTIVKIPLEKYMELCGTPLTKSSKDLTRKKVKDDLENLYNISLEWSESSGKKTKDFAKMRICTSVGIANGVISFGFSPEMASYLTNSYLMQYPIELLKTDERNPNSYHIGKKLLIHHSMDNNKLKGTSQILSVKKLLEVCPDIPTRELVMSTSRDLDRRIRVPFEKALDSLAFIDWEYCNSKGTPLSDEQLSAFDFSVFEELYIKFVVIGLQEQPARLQAKAEKKKQNSASKGTSRKRSGKAV